MLFEIVVRATDDGTRCDALWLCLSPGPCAWAHSIARLARRSGQRGARAGRGDRAREPRPTGAPGECDIAMCFRLKCQPVWLLCTDPRLSNESCKLVHSDSHSHTSMQARRSMARSFGAWRPSRLGRTNLCAAQAGEPRLRPLKHFPVDSFRRRAGVRCHRCADGIVTSALRRPRAWLDVISQRGSAHRPSRAWSVLGRGGHSARGDR